MDFVFEVEGLGRWDLELWRDGLGLCLLMRPRCQRQIGLAQLGLPAETDRLLDVDSGLVLIAGPSGSGRSTTQGALTAALLARRSPHAVMVRGPEFGESLPCSVPVLRAGREVPDVASGLAMARAVGAQVLLVDPLVGSRATRAVLAASEAGCLVIATTSGTEPEEIASRLAREVPGGTARLAGCLVALLLQELVPGNGGARVLAAALLRGTSGDAGFAGWLAAARATGPGPFGLAEARAALSAAGPGASP
jgi:twitching motility protein PilT